MSQNTNIEWADHTFNPWTGCTKISPACDNCYAEAWAKRSGQVKWGVSEPRRLTSPTNWRLPLRWNAQHDTFYSQHDRRQRVFCASLADVFDNAVDPQWRMDLFRLIADTPNLDWLILTKRIGNVMPMCRNDSLMFDMIGERVWLGATICNQEEADRDIPKLLQIPAPIRFLSIEPLLGPVNLRNLTHEESELDSLKPETWEAAIEQWRDTDENWIEQFEDWFNVTLSSELAGPMHSGIDWVIAGGESGPGARPLHPDWVRGLQDQCSTAQVPFLFKQWGEWIPINQMTDTAVQRLYRSNVKARKHESQDAIDECYGRKCSVETGVIHIDGTMHSNLEPMAFLQGTEAMLTFKVGKKSTGRQLDGREWNEVPA